MRFLAEHPKLRVVGRGGVGMENIDVAACRKRDRSRLHARCQHAGGGRFGLRLSCCNSLRPWCIFRERATSRKSSSASATACAGRQLNELTLGILGMGRVGRRVGHIAANGFGMRVIYNDLIDVARHAAISRRRASISRRFTARPMCCRFT